MLDIHCKTSYTMTLYIQQSRFYDSQRTVWSVKTNSVRSHDIELTAETLHYSNQQNMHTENTFVKKHADSHTQPDWQSGVCVHILSLTRTESQRLWQRLK